MTLSGHTVIVTGAARGIGRSTALTLAERGARVVVGDVDEAGVAETAEAVRAAGGDALAVAADVTSDASCAHLVEAAVERFGRLDALVNNAAVGAFALTVETTSEEEWDRILAVNLKSVFLMSRHAVPHIRRAGGGVIVNISSVHAFATSPGVAPYAAAKGGVLALTRTMALDLAQDRIRVVCVVPGAVDTPMLRSHAERMESSLEALGFSFDERAIGRVSRPDEIARAIAFLVSDDASSMTGSALVADGGLLARF